ncbi:DUF6587 family protein [Bordetella sp. FB-8]|uniref:DUF6587 family protein n=1 Tax=Bordetella sp. FB-8 TaxID=1159870 RepID=UPI00037B9D4F|nr:DUF6587 family protein [Bordetella sp. FB-8]
MNAAVSWWQYAVLGLLVLASAVQVMRKIAPRLAARGQARAAAALDRAGRPQLLRAVGRWMRPREAAGNCGDGCGTCGSCTPGATNHPGDVQPITFRKDPRNGCH